MRFNHYDLAPGQTVVGKSTGRARFALMRTLAAFWEKLPPPIQRFLAWWIQPPVLWTLAITATCLFAIGFYYYLRFSAEIDARLRRDAFDGSARIIAAPLSVDIGDRFGLNELSSYLESAGYYRSSDGDSEGSFSINGSAVNVIPTAYGASVFGLAPAQIEISGGRVSNLTDLTKNRRVSSLTLEGPLLASMKDGDRQKRMIVEFSEIPAPLRNAVIATEDRRFFDHAGVDWRGVSRALKVDLQHGEIVQGGSTITQQLIKNAFLTRKRSWRRKIKEAAMALILESRLSKEEIFALYCSDVYLGQSGRFAIRGFAEAAQLYFDKRLDQLTLGESSFLAGLVHAPNRYAVHRDVSQMLARRGEVLDAMVEQGSTPVEEAERAKVEPLAFVTRRARDDHGVSYFIDYTENFVAERYGWEALASQSRIFTTLDLRLQQAAYDAVATHTERIDRLMKRHARKRAAPQPVQAALVALDPRSGEILAMIGGRNYDESQFNRVTDALRQPGSTFKPFIYASALSQRRYTAATLLSDRPQTFTYDGGREYKPADYGGGFGNRDVTLAEALARSLNVPTVQLAEQIGLSTVADMAENCGLPQPGLYPSMALGTSEVTLLNLATGYTAFVDDGTARRPTPIRGISWPDGRASETVRARAASALSPQVAFLMTHLLSTVVNGGTGSRVRTLGFHGDAAGKTGTSRDGWFVGYSPNLLCAVWVGFDDNRELGLKGSDSALPIWVDFMRRALEVRPELGGKFSQPAGLTSVQIDPTTGLLSSENCPISRRMLFLSGTEPRAICTHDLSDESMLEYESTDDQNQPDEIDGEVTLDVCAATGLLPSPECRSLKKRTVRWTELPIETCNPALHDKTLPPANAKPPPKEPSLEIPPP